MSVQQVEEIIRRAETDPSFRDWLKRDPQAALHGYDLTVAERQAVISGDSLKLADLGVSPEMSLRLGEINASGSPIPGADPADGSTS